MTEKVYVYYNGDLFTVTEDGELYFVMANDYLTHALQCRLFTVDEIIEVSECLGSL